MLSRQILYCGEQLPNGAAGDLFGFSVSLSGNNALVGSHFDDDKGTDSGSAYLFDVTTGNLLHKLTAPDGAAGDQFGFPVSLSDNTALIGGFGDDDQGLNSGSAYLFDVTTGDFLQPRFRTSKCSIKKYIVLKSPKIIPGQEYFSFH
ncbi:FG-GAP repeat protein [Crocosphaera watsonii WH 8501]|uniref:Integrins alpha chain n=1 Tax=Crocosphaera watsonii WH 8501 TaxID=165597 RepID=Q4BUA1_CROWT|nr:FG-GAP repeat protein [Crocosphaera watsonii]EAM47480.1 hypothetical protein CwatDRAFT_0001 [Crocosphaera watsonii WH 8501]